MQVHVPGLVTLTNDGIQAHMAITQLNEDGSVKTKNHRLLIKPNPFNVSILFQPYLAFIESAKEVVNLSSVDEESRIIGSFMDDFIQRTYLPQLEEKVTTLFHQAVNGTCSGSVLLPLFHVYLTLSTMIGHKAFLRDVNWPLWSSHPVVNVSPSAGHPVGEIVLISLSLAVWYSNYCLGQLLVLHAGHCAIPARKLQPIDHWYRCSVLSKSQHSLQRYVPL